MFATLDPVFDLLLIFAMKSSSDLGTACFLVSFFSFLPSSSLNRDCLDGLSLLVSVRITMRHMLNAKLSNLIFTQLLLLEDVKGRFKFY